MQSYILSGAEDGGERERENVSNVVFYAQSTTTVISGGLREREKFSFFFNCEIRNQRGVIPGSRRSMQSCILTYSKFNGERF